MSDTLLVIDAGRVLTPLKQFSPGRLVIEGPSIKQVGGVDAVAVPPDAERINALALLAVPGFIEPHIHGCGGVDIMDGSYESLNLVSRILPRHGTTSFLATTVSSPPDVLTTAVEQIATHIAKSFEGAQPLGIHLEGPFINASRRGTHKLENVTAPDPALLDRWARASNNSIRLITLAPELSGIEHVLRVAHNSHIVAGMGHSNASLEEARAAVDAGVCYAVHTFNAMRSFSHRDPGIVGEVLTDDRVFTEVIADGVHVDPSAIQLLARAKGKGKIVLVTDAVSAMDMPDGTYTLGGDVVQVVQGVCRDSDGRLAGSTLNQERALHNFRRWTGWPIEDALLGLTLNPARALGLRGKGLLEPGADADVVLLDHNFTVAKTFVKGKPVFDRLWTN